MSWPAATRLICPLTADNVRQMRADMTAAASAGADMVECRLDYLATVPAEGDLELLLRDPPLPVIVTCRAASQGGLFKADEKRRLQVLHAAAKFKPAFIDVEYGTMRGNWPAAPIILSYHDFARMPPDIRRLAHDLDASDAAVNKIAFAAAGPQEALEAMDILRHCRKPTICLAMGMAGLPSRVMARKFKAFGTFAALGEGGQSAPGQPTIEEFRRLYRWDSIGPRTSLLGVIGCPVEHSMSPAIHNAAFDAAGLDAVYLPLRIEPGRENFNRFMDALLARPWLDWRGLSVTIPHKEAALAYVGDANCDELARRIGAVNTITIQRGTGVERGTGVSPASGTGVSPASSAGVSPASSAGVSPASLRGDNTDYAAAIDALCQAMRIERSGLGGRSVAVLGAGGVARAIVAALAHYGAEVTIYNRTVERAAALAEEFRCRAAALGEAAGTHAQILINCTSIGMHPKVGEGPLAAIPPSVKVVFDTIYNPIQTHLLHQAKGAGCLCVSGLEMFVNQAVAQFEIWTGRPAPREVMRRVVVERLS